jgi:hypothetical protein
MPHLGPNTAFLLLSLACWLMWSALSEERTGLSIAIAAGCRQHSLSLVRVSEDLTYFVVSGAGLPQSGFPGSRIYTLPETQWPNYIDRYGVRFPSPPTTRWATVVVFETASTLACRYLVTWPAQAAYKTPHFLPMSHLLIEPFRRNGKCVSSHITI